METHYENKYIKKKKETYAIENNINNSVATDLRHTPSISNHRTA
jgi:hypothetical protein